MSHRLRIGCAVVTYESAGIVGGLLDSMHLLEPDAAAIVDHGSTDGTVALLEAWRPRFDADVLRRPNRGYAAGVNAAVTALRDRDVDIVVVLNPDTRIVSADVAGLRDLFTAQPRLGSLCPLTLGPEGHRLDTLGLRLTPWASAADHGQGRPADWTGTRPIPGVIGPCGGSAVYRTEALDSVAGPLDERFFMYFEDADLALRLRAVGWTTVTSDLVTVQHERGGLGGRTDDLRRPGARRATVERQRSYERFVSSAPLSLPSRVLGRAAALVRRQLIRRRLRRHEVAHP